MCDYLSVAHQIVPHLETSPMGRTGTTLETFHLTHSVMLAA